MSNSSGPRTTEDEKVLTASYYMEGTAQQWYYRLERNRGVPTWPQFIDFVNRRFGPPVRSNPLGELAHLRRTGSVSEYRTSSCFCLPVVTTSPSANKSISSPPASAIHYAWTSSCSGRRLWRTP